MSNTDDTFPSDSSTPVDTPPFRTTWGRSTDAVDEVLAAEDDAAKTLDALLDRTTGVPDPRARLHVITALDRLIAAESGFSQRLREARVATIKALRAEGMRVPEIARLMGVDRSRVYQLLEGNPRYGSRRADAEDGRARQAERAAAVARGDGSDRAY